MDPTPNPNQSPYSIDYLNQIAPQQKKPGMSNKFFVMVAGAGLIIAIIVGIIALTSSGAGPTQKMQTLAARLTTLQGISSKAQKNIKSGELRSTNSSLTIFLTNANRDIIAPLAKNGVDVKKTDKKLIALENGAALIKKLDDARLNAVYDRTYAREMGYQLDTVIALMKDVYANTKSKTLKDFLVATNKNILPIKKQLQAFSDQ